MTVRAWSWSKLAATASITVVLFALTAELSVRALDPVPRVQVVRGATLPWHLVDGVPQWTVSPDLAPVMEGRSCQADPSARQVALVGDSVLQVSQQDGSPSGDAQTRLRAHLVTQLQDRLNAAGSQRWCVRDLAQSGYLPYQFEVALRTAHAEAPVDVAIVEVFKAESRYTPLGPDLYALHGWPRTAAGVPKPWPWIPDAVQEALFGGSAAWAYASIALGEPDPRSPDLDLPLDRSYRTTVDWALAHGVDTVLLQVPVLDIPFAQSAADGAGEWAALEADAQARGVGVLRLAEALKDEDVTKLRLDTCCHYAPAGHAAIARVLADALLARAAPASTAQAAP